MSKIRKLCRKAMGSKTLIQTLKYPLVLMLYLGIIITTHAQNTSKGDKPNIIVIFTDDHGFADLGVQGQVDDIKTPHIDQMADEGIRMTAGYITAPQCTPSRAGLLTGKYQQRFGVDDINTGPLPLDEVLISQRLKKAGYVTGMTGKWHLEPNNIQNKWIKEHIPDLVGKRFSSNDIPFSKKLPYMPSERGFDDCFEGNMIHYWVNYDLEGNTIEKQHITDKRFRIDVQTDAALTFIDRNHDKPFFFYLPYYGPHVPLEATAYYLSRFPGDMPMRRRYALAMLAAIDDGVGAIRQSLKDYGILDNTIIFFISDNGAPLKIDKKDEPINIQRNWNGSLNDPWIGEKGMLSEGGIRVPFIVSWPSKLPKGITYDRPVSSLDVAATSVALAGLEEVEALDGVNLIPYLTGERPGDPHESLYWRFWGQGAIREGDMKYLKAGDREFLFNLASDEHEAINIIDQQPTVATRMRAKLEQWASELHNPGLVDDLGRGGEDGWYKHYFKE